MRDALTNVHQFRMNPRFTGRIFEIVAPEYFTVPLGEEPREGLAAGILLPCGTLPSVNAAKSSGALSIQGDQHNDTSGDPSPGNLSFSSRVTSGDSISHNG